MNDKLLAFAAGMLGAIVIHVLLMYMPLIWVVVLTLVLIVALILFGRFSKSAA